MNKKEMKELYELAEESITALRETEGITDLLTKEKIHVEQVEDNVKVYDGHDNYASVPRVLYHIKHSPEDEAGLLHWLEQWLFSHNSGFLIVELDR